MSSSQIYNVNTLLSLLVILLTFTNLSSFRNFIPGYIYVIMWSVPFSFSSVQFCFLLGYFVLCSHTIILKIKNDSAMLLLLINALPTSSPKFSILISTKTKIAVSLPFVHLLNEKIVNKTSHDLEGTWSIVFLQQNVKITGSPITIYASSKDM